MIVRVNIKDVNDNPPVFEAQEPEIVASVPTTAQYGHHVTRIQVSVLCHACLSVICASFDDTNPKASLFITEMLVSRSFKHRQRDSAMHIISPSHQVGIFTGYHCHGLNFRVKALPKKGKSNNVRAEIEMVRFCLE